MTDTFTFYMDKAAGVFIIAIAAALFVSPVAAMLSSALFGVL